VSQDRALCFVHPDQDAGTPGLQLAPGSLKLATVGGGRAVRQAILLLLSTRPGERVMRPDYGCDLHRLAFAPNDETTAALAIHYVRQALARWEPRADVLDLDATPDPERGLLTIRLAYQVRLTQQRDEIAFDLRLE
jgi:phage baseplate assembly protein W